MPLRWRGVRGTNSNSHDRRRVCVVGVRLEFVAVGETRTRIGAVFPSRMQRAHAVPRCKPDQSEAESHVVRQLFEAAGCRIHGARGGAPEGKRNGNYRLGAMTKETIGL